MDLCQVVRKLHLEDYKQFLQDSWTEAQKSDASDGVWLQESYIQRLIKRLGIEPVYAIRIADTARTIARNEALRAYATYCHFCLFLKEGGPPSFAYRWPSVEALQKTMTDAAFFYMVVFMSGFDQIEEKLRAIQIERGIEEKVLEDTLTSITLGIPTYLKETGGLSPSSLMFRLRTGYGGEYYCLGRLSFNFGRFFGRIHVFRHKTSKQTMALADEGLTFTREGLLYDDKRRTKQTDLWHTCFSMDASSAVGHRVTPNGDVQNSMTTLDLSDWSRLLKPEDPILVFHIPTGPSLPHAECGESFRAAQKFFAKHFPEKEVSVFASVSWLFDSDLQDMLPESANLIRFQREFYLFPFYTDDDEIYKKVFGCAWDKKKTPPLETSLQRAVYQRIRNGKPPQIRAGGAFLLMDDLDWGKRAYQRQEDK